MGGAYVEFRLKEVEALAQLLNKISLTASQEKQLLAGIGVELEEVMKDRIANTKTEADGEKWDDITESTRKLYQKYGKDTSYQNLLHRSGDLRDSVESQVKSKSVLVGATKFYASYLNDGTSQMVARQFTGIGQSDIHLLIGALNAYLEEIIS